MKKYRKPLAALTAAALTILSMPQAAMADGTREVIVSTTDELHAALKDAKAGDEIILKEGTYLSEKWIDVWAVFYSEASGTADKPIVIRSEDPEHPALLKGRDVKDKVGLRIKGSYWEIRDLAISTAAKGIFLEQSEHTIISGCEVYNIGGEAIHIIDDSSYNLVENCYVHDTGKDTPQYGEGVYIGSSHKATEYGFDCHYNTVRGCKFGPNITADHVDIKEYTVGNLVEYCTFDGTGIMGQNGGDSFVEVKGNECIIRYNTGHRNGCEKMVYAFDMNVQLDGWGQNNKVYDNTVYLDSADIPIVKEWNCATQVFRNTADPAECTYTSSKTLHVLEFDLKGDSTEDGCVNAEDVQRLQDYLLDREIPHISGNNADLSEDTNLSAFDLCILKRKIQEGKTDEKAIMSVGFVKEEPGAWRMTDGLSERTVTFHVHAEAGHTINTAWGYYDGYYVDPDTGKQGKWFQISTGKFDLDENGNAEITVEVPTEVRRVAFEIYDYMDGSTKLDKDVVELVKVVTQ